MIKNEDYSTFEKVGRFFRYHKIQLERSILNEVKDILKSLGKSSDDLKLKYWEKVNNIIENVNEWENPEKTLNELKNKLPELITIRTETKRKYTKIKKDENWETAIIFGSHEEEISNTRINDAFRESQIAIKNVKDIQKKIKIIEKIIEIKEAIRHRMNELEKLFPSNELSIG